MRYGHLAASTWWLFYYYWSVYIIDSGDHPTSHRYPWYVNLVKHSLRYLQENKYLSYQSFMWKWCSQEFLHMLIVKVNIRER
jgi:hypothetical protein